MPKVFQKHHPQEDSPEEEQSRPQISHEPVRTLLEWKAPTRPFKKKGAAYYRTIAIIAVLVILISALMREFILIGAVLALGFVVYVLGFIPPEDIDYKVSTQGITIGDHFYFWSELDSFWLSNKDGAQVLNVLTNLRFPAQLIIHIGDQDPQTVRNIIAQYLPFREIAPKSFVDNWGDRLQRYFPLDSSKA